MEGANAGCLVQRIDRAAVGRLVQHIDRAAIGRLIQHIDRADPGCGDRRESPTHVVTGENSGESWWAM